LPFAAQPAAYTMILAVDLFLNIGFDVAHFGKHASDRHRYVADASKRFTLAYVRNFVAHQLYDVIGANALWIFAVLDDRIDREPYSVSIFWIGFFRHFLPPLQIHLRERIKLSRWPVVTFLSTSYQV